MGDLVSVSSEAGHLHLGETAARPLNRCPVPISGGAPSGRLPGECPADLLVAENQNGREFRRLANALSALYPNYEEGRRLLTDTLQAIRRSHS